jgi:hypothetical protein
LDGVLFVAEGLYILAGLNGTEFSGRSVFVRTADKEYIVADLSPEPCMYIGRKKRADEIAEMLDAVHVRKGTGNKRSGHGSDLSRVRMPNPENQKALPRDQKGLDSAYAWRENARTIPSGRTPCGRAGAFASGMAQWRKSRRNLQELAQINTARQNCQMGLIGRSRAV